MGSPSVRAVRGHAASHPVGTRVSGTKRLVFFTGTANRLKLYIQNLASRPASADAPSSSDDVLVMCL